MSAPYDKIDYLGEPVILTRGHQLCGLLTVCERAVASLDSVGSGPYRDKVMSGLGQALELADDIAAELLIALEEARPARMTGGQRNG
jgi:hypothetical protein